MPHFSNHIVALLFFYLSPLMAMAVINGPINPNPLENTTYTYNDGAAYTLPNWTISNGTIVSSSSSGTTYTAIVQWTSSGAGVLTFKSKFNIVDNLSVYVRPIKFNLSGGGYFCSGSAGVSIALSGSELNTSYQLYKDGQASGSSVSGTGNSITWNNISQIGDYSCIATQASVTQTMNGLPYVGLNPSPTIYSLSGPGGYCTGSATLTLSGSETAAGASYQLVKDGSNVGSAVTGTGSALSWANQSIMGHYTVVATNSPGCASTMDNSFTIYSNLNAGSIESNQTICYNSAPSSLTNVQSASGGFGTYNYQWKSSTDGVNWTNITGATSVTLSPLTLATTTQYRRTVSISCTSANSNDVIITVYPTLNPGSIATNQTICSGTAPSPLTSSANSSGGNGSYSYQWQSSPNNSIWTDISTATSTTFSPGTLSALTYYRRKVVSCGETKYSNTVTISIYSALNAGSIDGTKSICYNTSGGTMGNVASASGSTGSYSYQWQKKEGAGSWTNIAGATSTTYPAGNLTVTTSFRRAVSTTCGTVYTNEVTVTVYSVFSAGSIANSQTICYSAVPAGLTSSQNASGGNGSFTYQWQSSPDGTNWTNISGETGTTYPPASLTSTTHYRRYASTGCGNGYSNVLIIIVYPTLNPGSIGSSQTICSGTAPSPLTSSANASGGNGSHSYQWQSSPNNSTWADISGATSTTFSPGALSALTYYRRKVTSCGETKYSGTVTITANPVSNAGTLSQSATVFGSATGTLTLSGYTGTIQKWQSKTGAGNWVDISNTTASQPYNVSSTTDYRTWVKSGVCSEVVSNEVSIVIHPLPVVTAPTDRIALSPVTLDAGPGYITYSWKNSSNATVGSNQTYTTSTPGAYTVVVTKTGVSGSGTSIPFNLLGQFEGLNNNYIVSNTIQTEGVFNEASIPSLTVDQNSQSIQYFDGLGRPIQSVSTQGSPGKNDIVQPVVYDQYGREAAKYLPYVSDEVNGWFKNSALTSQNAFYAGTDKVAIDPNPYALTIFEPSPLNRILEQGAPGEAWQPDGVNSYTSTDRTIKKTYEFNTATEVLLWTYTPPDATYPFGKVNTGTASSPVYYNANELYKNKTKDEEHHEVIEYVDKQNRVVLKRVQATGTQTINDTNYASTYYIYDDFGSLVCVIPPEATKRLATEYYQAAATDATKNAFLKRWAFRYAFDARKRKTMVQNPGAEPVYMVYDNRDRLVLTQDGNQRTANRWTFTKYDALNRPVLTGIHVTGAGVGQDSLQLVVNTFYANMTASEAWYETFTGNATDVFGYDDKSFPKATPQGNYLTVTWYDNYDFKTLLTDSSRYSFKADELTGQETTYFKRLAGQVTGTKIKVLNGGTAGYTWLSSVNYFDDRYRVIQTVTDNYKNAQDRATNVYDFVGKVLSTRTTHETNAFAWTDKVGIRWLGDKLTNTAGSWGTSGAASVQMIPAETDGWFEFSPTFAHNTMIGFSTANANAHWNTIKYALYLLNNGTLQVRENGGSTNYLGSGFTYQAGDMFRVERRAGQINYYKNGILLLQRSAVSNALIIDLAIGSSGGELSGFRTSFGNFTQQSVNRSFVYDHAGRLMQTWHKINNADSVLLAENEYNELGQLVTKKLHSEDNGTSFRQVVDHRYNIRGWMTRINNSDLTPDDANNPLDYFGMELAYNNDIGIGAVTPQFNGNISAAKWSANLGLGIPELNQPKERAYAFSYDALNRLTAANHQAKLTAWNASAAFHENNLSYDLNGNILTLNRTGKNGLNMDVLTYNYGTAATASNKLLAVTDAGNRSEGFKEVGTTGTDYVYDVNGNMVWDRNKGGEELLTNGNFESGSADWTLTDTESRLNFTNNEVQITAGSVTALLKQAVIVKGKPYVVVIDLERTAGTMTVYLGGATTNLTSTGLHVLSITAGNSTTEFRLTAGTTFAGKIKSASVKGVTVISYNHLNLPEIVTRAGDKQLQYIYDATGRKLTQELSEAGALEKRTDYAGEYIYENDTLRFINHEEGRVVMTGAPEYQYHLKDHLGNVRLTFTTKQEVDESTGTYEPENAVEEQSEFLRYDNAKLVNSTLFDKTNGASTGYAERLNGTANEKYGLAKSISVMPGDTINAEVYAKYVDTNSANWTAALNSLMSQIGSGEPGVVVDGANYASSTTSFPFAGLLDTGGSSSNGPKAYLNWLVFDRDYNLQLNGTGYMRMTDIAKEFGQDVAHERLYSPEIIIKEPGYVYIYLSNEEPEASPVEVYFDDFKVTHTKSPIIQSEDFYPFGLTFNSYSRENSTPQNYKYNGMELQDELSLNWLDFGARMYDPAIARWMVIDPLADAMRSWSPYNYVFNNPLRFIDPDGMGPNDCEGCKQRVVGSEQYTTVNSVEANKNSKGDAISYSVNFTLQNVKNIEVVNEAGEVVELRREVTTSEETVNVSSDGIQVNKNTGEISLTQDLLIAGGNEATKVTAFQSIGKGPEDERNSGIVVDNGAKTNASQINSENATQLKTAGSDYAKANSRSLGDQYVDFLSDDKPKNNRLSATSSGSRSNRELNEAKRQRRMDSIRNAADSMRKIRQEIKRKGN